MIGYATPTPATDGQALYALFGTGVIARIDATGHRTWARWLGAPPRPMRGYPIGTAASPQLVDGVLVVPYGQLRGLDPATGADRWTSGPWTDFGTPAVARVGGVAWLVTPDGHAVRAKDGFVGATGLADIAWSSPTADGDHVWFAGGASGDPHGPVTAHEVRLVRLVPTGVGVRGEVVWKTTVPATARVYATPVVTQGRVIVVSDVGELAVLDAERGTLLQQLKLGGYSAGHTPSPVVAGSVLIVASEHGGTDLLRVSSAGVTPIATIPFEGSRATPLPEGGRVYVRTMGALVAVGR
jgi:outer membrane protein assembly factor BamB